MQKTTIEVSVPTALVRAVRALSRWQVMLLGSLVGAAITGTVAFAVAPGDEFKPHEPLTAKALNDRFDAVAEQAPRGLLGTDEGPTSTSVTAGSLSVGKVTVTPGPSRRVRLVASATFFRDNATDDGERQVFLSLHVNNDSMNTAVRTVRWQRSDTMSTSAIVNIDTADPVTFEARLYCGSGTLLVNSEVKPTVGSQLHLEGLTVEDVGPQ